MQNHIITVHVLLNQPSLPGLSASTIVQNRSFLSAAQNQLLFLCKDTLPYQPLAKVDRAAITLLHRLMHLKTLSP